MSILAYSKNMELVESYVTTYHIYVLKNPENNEIFYVGKTVKDLRVRLSGHLSDLGNGTIKGDYLKKMHEKGFKPVIEDVETIYGTCYIDKIKANEREIFWIKHYKASGSPMTNILNTETNASCYEYQKYLRDIENRDPSWHFYYCGKTSYNVKVYDEEKLNEDGFELKLNTGEMTPNYEESEDEFKETITYEPIYDDNNPQYVVQSLEEI